MSDEDVDLQPKSAAERTALGVALLLNVGLAAGLGVAGFYADSSALTASAVDNLSDAAVYGISYYAATRGSYWKTRAAGFSGLTLIVLALAVFGDVVRRFLMGSEPASGIMIGMTIGAAIINIVCLRLLRGLHRGRQPSRGVDL